MNQGQERFFNFILERVKEDKVEEAKALLTANFRKQAEGTFTHEDIMQSTTKITALLKPEKIEEVKAVMKQFAETSGH
jgi:Tfp pilus assembly pilus retraction ATPase PilT